MLSHSNNQNVSAEKPTPHSSYIENQIKSNRQTGFPCLSPGNRWALNNFCLDLPPVTPAGIMRVPPAGDADKRESGHVTTPYAPAPRFFLIVVTDCGCREALTAARTAAGSAAPQENISRARNPNSG